MPPADNRAAYSPIDGVAFDIQAPRSGWPVVIAGVVIVLLAGLGLYRGLTSARPASAGQPAEVTGAIVGAKPAVASPQSPTWSTLSGPQILPPPTPKVQAQDDDDDDDDSGAPADQPAADQADDAPVVTPPAVGPPVAYKPATPAPKAPAAKEDDQ